MSTIIDLIWLWSFTFLKWYYYSNFLDFQFWSATIILILFTFIKNFEFTEDTKNAIKYISQTIFISLFISLIGNFLSLIYSTLFYYGFINTIISAFFITSMIPSISSYMSNYPWVKDKSKKFKDNAKIYIKYIFFDYLTPTIKFVINKFLAINRELSNPKSEMIKRKYIDSYTDPFFLLSSGPSLDFSQFKDLSKLSFDIPEEYNYDISDKFNSQNKNNLLNSGIDMNFLQDTTIECEDIDDLTDDDEKSLEVNIPTQNTASKKKRRKKKKKTKTQPVVPEIKEQEVPSVSETNEEPDENLSRTERRAALRKKLDEKKKIRMSKPALQKNLSEMTGIDDMSEMKDMMEKLMKGKMGGVLKNMMKNGDLKRDIMKGNNLDSIAGELLESTKTSK